MAFDKRKALQAALAYTQQGRLDKAINELDKMGDSLLKVGTAFQKVQEGVSKTQFGSGITKEDLKMLIEELRRPQGSDLKSNLAVVKEFFAELRSVDQDIKALTGMGQLNIPPEIAARLPGWSLMLYYPPSQAIKEFKDASKEVVEHAIRTAKGEIEESKESQTQSSAEESFLDKYRRKMQTKGA